jgi:hypothetical protein
MREGSAGDESSSPVQTHSRHRPLHHRKAQQAKACQEVQVKILAISVCGHANSPGPFSPLPRRDMRLTYPQALLRLSCMLLKPR